MRTSVILLSVLSFLPAAAFAQDAPQKMRHMTIAPDEPKPAPVKEEPKPEDKPKEKPAPARKKLTPEEALVKPDDLKEWSGMAEAVQLINGGDLDKMLRSVEADPGSVPPMGLLMIAKALADQKRMEEAALYYYVAQIRSSFDAARWPPRMDPEDIKRLRAEQSKAADQQGQITGASQPRIKNPHEGVASMSALVSPAIASWLFADPERAVGVLTQAQAWDESAKYEYKPGYDVPEPMPFKEWPKLLTGSRQGFFARMNEFLGGLRKLKAE